MKKVFFSLKTLFIPCSENDYKPKFLESRFLTCYVAFLIILKLLIIPIFSCLPKSIFFADVSKTAIISLINKERTENNLPLLKENQLLNDAAELKANDMFSNEYFNHESPSGIVPWYWFKKAGYNYNAAGENLAIGFIDSDELYEAWYDSPSHKANLLNSKYNETGIAIVEGNFQGQKTSIVVQTFGLQKTTQEPKITEEVEGKETTEQTTKIVANQEVLSETAEATEGGKTTEQTTKIVANQEVLSETYEREKVPEFKFWNFIASSYYGSVQKIMLYTFLFIILSLSINILINIGIQRKGLIIKASCFLALLIGFYLLDKVTLIQLIPHNLVI